MSYFFLHKIFQFYLILNHNPSKDVYMFQATTKLTYFIHNLLWGGLSENMVIYCYTGKPVLRGHLWDKENMTF